MFLRWNESGHDYIFWWSCGPSFGFIQNCRRGKNTHAAWLMAAIISTSKSNSCDSQIQIQTHVTNWFMRQSISFFKSCFDVTNWIAKWGSRFHLAANHAGFGFINRTFISWKASSKNMPCRISVNLAMRDRWIWRFLTYFNFRLRWLLEAELNFWHQWFQICPSRMTSRRFVGWSG